MGLLAPLFLVLMGAGAVVFAAVAIAKRRRIAVRAAPWPWVAAILGVLTALLGALLFVSGDDGSTVEEVRAWVARELPNGTPYEEIVRTLEGRGAEHSKLEARDQKVYAKLRCPSRGFVERCILLEFRFDDRGRLIEAAVREAFTGP